MSCGRKLGFLYRDVRMVLDENGKYCKFTISNCAVMICGYSPNKQFETAANPYFKEKPFSNLSFLIFAALMIVSLIANEGYSEYYCRR